MADSSGYFHGRDQCYEPNFATFKLVISIREENVWHELRIIVAV